MQDVMARCLKRLSNVRSSAAWEQWHGAVAYELHAESLALRCLERMSHAALSRGWCTLCAAVKYSRDLEAASALESLSQQLLLSQQKGALRTMRRCLQRFRNMRLVQSWEMWFGKVLAGKRAGDVIARCLGRIGNQQLLAVWNQWQASLEAEAAIQLIEGGQVGGFVYPVHGCTAGRLFLANTERVGTVG